MMPDRIRNVVIIGAGPAAYAAALYAARAQLDPLVYTGGECRAQLATPTVVENYPGFPDGILGSTLLAAMRQQATRFGADLAAQTVRTVNVTDYPFRVTANHETTYAQALILATGGVGRVLGVPGEAARLGHGVWTGLPEDEWVLRGRHIVVVGGGDAALEAAVYASGVAHKVTIVHRRATFRASPWMRDRIQIREEIAVEWESVVDAVLGTPDTDRNGRIQGVRLRQLRTSATRMLEADGLIVAIGRDPQTALVRGQVPLDAHGYVQTRTGEETATAMPGVFAAGEVRDRRYRQVVTAVSDGCKAALDAERWLADRRNEGSLSDREVRS